MQKETRFKIKVLKKLKKLPRSWWYKTVAVSVAGIPDVIGCLNGMFVALELKPENRAPTLLQSFVLAKIREAGGYARVLHPENLEDVLHDLQSLVDDPQLPDAS